MPDEIALDENAHQLWALPLGAGMVTFEALSSRIHPEDLDRVRAAFTATREILGPYEVDFRIIHGRDIRWISARGRGDDEGIVGRIMFGVFLDVTGRKLAEEGRELLSLEISHRVKNLFSIASALTRIASRSATTPQEMAHDIQRRLLALGNAHELIRPSLSKQKKAVSLGELLTTLLAAYDECGSVGDRIRMAVPEILVGEASITILALVIHRTFATNSIKYGALSADAGTIDISSAETAADRADQLGPKWRSGTSSSERSSRLWQRTLEEKYRGSIGRHHQFRLAGGRGIHHTSCEQSPTCNVSLSHRVQIRGISCCDRARKLNCSSKWWCECLLDPPSRKVCFWPISSDRLRPILRVKLIMTFCSLTRCSQPAVRSPFSASKVDVEV